MWIEIQGKKPAGAAEAAAGAGAATGDAAITTVATSSSKRPSRAVVRKTTGIGPGGNRNIALELRECLTDQAVRRIIDDSETLEEVLEKLEKANWGLFAKNVTTHKQALVHCLRKKQAKKLKELEQDPATFEAQRKARFPRFVMANFDTPHAGALEKWWNTAIKECKPLWIYGRTGTGKTAWVETKLKGQVYKICNTKALDKYDPIKHRYLRGDDVNWEE